MPDMVCFVLEGKTATLFRTLCRNSELPPAEMLTKSLMIYRSLLKMEGEGLKLATLKDGKVVAEVDLTT
jgi:hypothetical protein